jgi:hypothetical protein
MCLYVECWKVESQIFFDSWFGVPGYFPEYEMEKGVWGTRQSGVANQTCVNSHKAMVTSTWHACMHTAGVHPCQVQCMHVYTRITILTGCIQDQF